MKNTNIKMTKNERENYIFDSIMSKYNNDGSTIDIIDQIQLLDIIRPNMHKSGKIENISSFDSAVLTCTFCQKMHENGKNDPRIVCNYCYAKKDAESFKGKNVRLNHDLKRRIFSTVVFSEQVLSSLMLVGLYRFNEDGDIENQIHADNYIKIAKCNPLAHFGFWAKNVKPVQNAIKKFGKPKNCTFIYSSPLINDFTDYIPKYFDYKFVVYTPKYINLAMRMQKSECNGKKCVDCGYKCYLNNHDFRIIAEKLRFTKNEQALIDLIDKYTFESLKKQFKDNFTMAAN